MSKPGVDGGVRGVSNVPDGQVASGRWSVADVYGYQLLANWPRSGLVSFTVQAGTTTIGSGQTQANVSISAVDLSETFLVFNFSSTTGNNDGILFPQGRFTSTTNINFQRGGTNDTVNIAWFAVSIPGATVQTVTDSITSGTSKDVTISAVDLSKTFVVASSRVGSGSTAGRGLLRASLTNATTLRLERGFSADTANITAFIVESP